MTAVDAHPDNLATPGGPCLKGLSCWRTDPGSRPPAAPAVGAGRGLPAGGLGRGPGPHGGPLAGIRSREGPRAVLDHAGSGSKGLAEWGGHGLLATLRGCTTTYGDLCWPAGLEATRLTLG